MGVVTGNEPWGRRHDHMTLNRSSGTIECKGCGAALPLKPLMTEKEYETYVSGGVVIGSSGSEMALRVFGFSENHRDRRCMTPSPKSDPEDAQKVTLEGVRRKLFEDMTGAFFSDLEKGRVAPWSEVNRLMSWAYELGRSDERQLKNEQPLKEVSQTKFYEKIGPMDVHPYPVGRHPYTSIFKTRHGLEVGRIVDGDIGEESKYYLISDTRDQGSDGES